MAIQNFSGGGFYGRVGSVVGFRKYGKFVLREWVRGTNPQTPAQQAHRGAFGEFSKVASYSLNLNRRSGVFDYRSGNEYSLRVKAAAQLANAGADFLDAFPVFPFGYTPEYQSTKITLISQTADDVHLFAVGTLPPTARTVGAVVAFYDSDLQSYDIEYTSGTITPSASGADIVLKNEWFGRWDTSTQIVLISQDDEAHSNTTYWQRQTAVEAQPIPEREFNFTVRSFTRSGRSFTLTFEEPFFENSQDETSATISAVSAGEIVSVNLPSVSFVNQGGYFGLTFSAEGTSDETILAFPAGSSISFPFVKIYGDAVHLISIAPSVALTSSDLTRGATLTAGTVSHVAGGLGFNFPAPSGVLAGGSVNVNYSGWTLFENKQITGTATTRYISGHLLFDFLPALRSDWCLPVFNSSATKNLSLEVVKNGVTYRAPVAILNAPNESAPQRVVTLPYFESTSSSPGDGLFFKNNANIFPAGFADYVTREYSGESSDYFSFEGWDINRPRTSDVTSADSDFSGIAVQCNSFDDSSIEFYVEATDIPSSSDVPTVFGATCLDVSATLGGALYKLTSPEKRVTFPD